MFNVYLVRRGVISAVQLVDALEYQHRASIQLGSLAIERKRLTMHQVIRILDQQALDPRPFGELAIELGFLTETDLALLLKEQADNTPSLTQILIDLGFASEGQLRREAERFHSLCASSLDNNPTAGELASSLAGLPKTDSKEAVLTN
ncbi:MAG: hypothetical protein KDA42_02555 [Planctomycetales bacterium]|nr:hypothetical protein [Planctomycetales bacterium]